MLEFAQSQERVRTADVLLQALAIPLDRLTRRDEMRVAHILKRAGYQSQQSRLGGGAPVRFWVAPHRRDSRDGRDNG